MRPVVKLLRRLAVRQTETLVMAQIEIGFRAVTGHEHLAVLKRAHGAGINIDVGVKLDQG